MEWFQHGHLVAALDEIRLAEYHLDDGSSYWLPIHCHQRIWRPGETDPVTERFFAIVAGSERFNLDLPDALFDVRRESAYPLPQELSDGTFARQFRTQVPAAPKSPSRTAPASIR